MDKTIQFNAGVPNLAMQFFVRGRREQSKLKNSPIFLNFSLVSFGHEFYMIYSKK